MLYAFSSSLDAYLAALHLSPALRVALDVQRGKLVGIEIPAGVSGTLRAEVQQAIDASFLTGFRLIMFISSGMALAGAVCIWFLVSAPPRPVKRNVEAHSGDNACTLGAPHQVEK